MEILIAEDDRSSRAFLMEILEATGNEPVPAEDGRQAWEILQNSNISMVVTDWMMPNMDGLELCRMIRDNDLSRYVYVLILTSKEGKEHCVEGLNAGADDYLVKPVNKEELHARIRAGQRIVELEEVLRTSQLQLLQSEKMASIGQLAAGVAHEINNPTGFVNSNLKTLQDYYNDIHLLLKASRTLVRQVQAGGEASGLPREIKEQADRIVELESEMDFAFMFNDLGDLIVESREGMERIHKIVSDLRRFAHPGEEEKLSDLNDELESTLNVVWHELKYKANVIKEYSELPPVKCNPNQINQVFMNLLVNSAQAMEEKGDLSIKTRSDDGTVEIEISDNGCGIPQENLQRIFDPFFTTKEVGRGTGLGLNVAYNIVQSHNGVITVDSKVGQGTTFLIKLPAAELDSGDDEGA